jgi:hypothetical protein
VAGWLVELTGASISLTLCVCVCFDVKARIGFCPLFSSVYVTETKSGNPVTTPSEIIPYYRPNHSIWLSSDNKESSR